MNPNTRKYIIIGTAIIVALVAIALIRGDAARLPAVPVA